MSSNYLSQNTPQQNINLACNDITTNNDVICNHDCIIQNNFRCFQNSVFDQNLNVGSLTMGSNGANLDMGDDNNIKTSDSSTGSIIALTPSEKLAFHGQTPGTQHSSTGEINGVVTNSGGSLHIDSTFTGNVGTKAYTLSDIVKSLKNKGLIASD